GPLPLETALSIAGVRAVFGEKYPDPVRVVTIGVPLAEIAEDPGNERWRGFSVELCGGTHLGDTAEAKRFLIVHEQALASGIRRITAVTGAAAEAAHEAARNLRTRIEQAGEGSPEEVKEIARQLDELTMGAVDRAQLAADVERLREKTRAIAQRERREGKAGLVEEARRLAAETEGPVIVAQFETTDRDGLLAAMDTIRGRHAEAAVMIFGTDDAAGKVSIVARVPEELIKRGLKAGDWVREAATACGGRGGGRPDMAQAGGKEPAKVPEAITTARAFAEKTLS
ncbi:MAG: DHHA1 domain-containing protein, partial [Planctomycetota bacterium]